MAGILQGANLKAGQAAALQREISRWRLERGTGETDLDFEPWLKVVAPQKWQQLTDKSGKAK